MSQTHFLLMHFQKTLKELERARAKSTSRFNPLSFLKARTSKTIEFFFTPDRTESLVNSFHTLPHRLLQAPSSPHDQTSLAKVSQNLIDDYSRMLLQISRFDHATRSQFIDDSEFAKQIIESHSTGWHDCCHDCGVSLRLKLNLTSNSIQMAPQTIADADKIVCKLSTSEHNRKITINTPSRILVMSDSLNNFLLDHSDFLSNAYKVFVSDKLKHIASTSVRGKLITTDFYATHNLAHLCTGKGKLAIERLADAIKMTRIDDSKTVEAPLVLDVRSNFVTLMDYSDFTAFCHQFNISTYEALKKLNACIVDADFKKLLINYSVPENNADNFTLEIRPASSSDIRKNSSNVA